jgi:SulP family sulfate permease
MARTRYKAQDKPVPLRDLPGAALRAVLREGYKAADLKSDILAGLVVGVVALPLAMALAIAVGVPPQHGLYTAIIAGFFAALLGGSRTQVSGPTAAFVVILAPIYVKFGLGGLLLSGLLGGVMLVLMGLMRLGRLIQFIPHPVTTGFTAGIATVIATLQLKDLFGLTLARNPEHYFERVQVMFESRGTASLAEVAVGLATLAILVFLPRFTKRIPAPLVALPVAAVVGLLLTKLIPGFHLATIGSRFHTTIAGHVVDGVPQLPPMPILPWHAGGPDGHSLTLSFSTLRELLPGSFAIAMLGAIESLLSAVVADGMARTRHDPDSELIAIGVGNLLSPFFGGIPATGAIARTATNIRSGARSPIASMVHALTVLAAILILAPLISYLPMTSLAALLLLVAWNMSEAKHFVHTLRVAPKSDVIVLLTCFALTVAVDMVVSVAVGIVLAALLFMRRMAEVTQAKLTEGEHAALPRPIPSGVVVYDIAGPLFFGAAQKAMATLSDISNLTRVVVLRLDQVPAMDATGLVALESALERLEASGCLTIIAGAPAQPSAALKKANILDRRNRLAMCSDTEAAFKIAEGFLATGTTAQAGVIPFPAGKQPVRPGGEEAVTDETR